MPEDYRQTLFDAFTESLVSEFSSEQIDFISRKFVSALADYEVVRRSTEVIPYDNENERILKRYFACLMIDGKSQKTIVAYRRSIADMLSVVQKNLKEIGTYDIRYYLAVKKENGVSNRTLENYRANMSAFFQWMASEEIIHKNPCERIKPIKYVDEVKEAFSPTEIDRLRFACKTVKQRAIIEVLLSSGLRVEELVSLELRDVNLETLAVHVRNGKGGKDRITYINDVATMHLKKYLGSRSEDGPFVFYSRNHQQYDTGGIRKLVRTLGEQAVVENVHPHRFRRTFATGLANRGMSIQEIQRLLGHSNVNTTLEYVCVDDSKVKSSYRQYIS